MSWAASATAEPAEQAVTVSKETTRIVAPLDAKGQVDYVAAVNASLRDGTTDENNAAPLLLKALGPRAVPVAVQEEVYKQLGMPPPPRRGEYLVSLRALGQLVVENANPPLDEPDRFLDQLEADLYEVVESPWQEKDFPVIARWVQVNEVPLARVSTALERSRLYVPVVADDARGRLSRLALPPLTHYGWVARLLSARAMLKLKAGDVEAAWRDLIACHRLARLVGQGATLVEKMAAIAMDGVAIRGDTMIAEHGGLSAAQAQKFREELEKLPPLPSVADALDNVERFIFLDSVIKQRPNVFTGFGPSEDGFDWDKLRALATSGAVDWNEVLKTGNRYYDRAVAACRIPSFVERQATIQAVMKEIQVDVKSAKSSALADDASPQVVSRGSGAILASTLLPSIDFIRETEDRARTLVDLTRVNLALAGYYADHEKYPGRLDDLVPKYMAKLPLDLYSERDFVYRTNGKRYLLYCIGPNREDNDGNGPFTNPLEGDDLTIQVPSED